jgi:DNA polymerase-4
MGRYAEASRGFFAILDDFSPLVQSLSLDEGFLDVTGAERLLGDGTAIATAIKQRVSTELELVASVGVAPTKFVAKIASDIDKPDGLRVVEPGRVLEFLHPLPLSRLWGVGKVTQAKLTEIGLRTIGDVARYPDNTLARLLGPALGAHLSALARGDDPREVETGGAPVSVGHEQTFDMDLELAADVASMLLHQADRVAARLRRNALRGRVVTLKIKYGDFRLVTRRRTLDDPTSDGAVIGRVAVELLGHLDVHGRSGKRNRVRLCGVSVGGLEARDAPRQLTMSEPVRERGERLGDALDRLEAKFGDGVVTRASAASGSPRKPTK